MRRLGGCWEAILAFPNLLDAYHKARRGKGTRPEVARFSLNLEGELLQLQDELASGTYCPGAYRLFWVYERKPRQIAAAPFRDRVVHHAVMNWVEPALDRGFIHDSYACRRGKGAHRAVARYRTWARRYPYWLKMDVARYFPSIDRQRLKAKLHRRIRDSRTLALLEQIIDRAPASAGGGAPFPGDDLLTPLERPRGIPIGNLTSQCFANLYLDEFDHWLRETRRVPAYLRYVDDMVVLGDDTARLRELRAAVAERLAAERLHLHPRKAEIGCTRDGLDLLGYRVFPDFTRLRNDNGHRFARTLRALAAAQASGRLSWRDIRPRLASWLGHAGHADTRGLRRRLLQGYRFPQ
jgi:RNA-directed DNA polymerase